MKPTFIMHYKGTCCKWIGVTEGMQTLSMSKLILLRIFPRWNITGCLVKQRGKQHKSLLMAWKSLDKIMYKRLRFFPLSSLIIAHTYNVYSACVLNLIFWMSSVITMRWTNNNNSNNNENLTFELLLLLFFVFQTATQKWLNNTHLVPMHLGSP